MDPVDNQPSDTDILEKISSDLFEEVERNQEHLSDGLQIRINCLSQDIRKTLVAKLQAGCSALFTACRKGNIKIVDYLIRECGSSIDQRGDLPSTKNISLLWCACMFSHLHIVKYLVNIGCDVNAFSTNNSTALQIACISNDIQLVKYLVENGADIQKPCAYGVTYLSDAVKSTPLCKYLISKGADVNGRDSFDLTVLHNAVLENNLEMIKLLLDHGVDPFVKDRFGNDALLAACTEELPSVAEYLMDRVQYSPERIADALLLLGSTIIHNCGDTQRALVYWRQAYDSRRGEHDYVQRRPQIAPRAAFRNAVEFTSIAELEEIALDEDALRMQGFVIQERIYGITHDTLLDRLQCGGYVFIYNGNIQTGIDLWILTLQERCQEYTILCNETCEIALIYLKFFLDNMNKENPIVRFQDVYTMFQIVSSNVHEVQQLLTIQPVCEKQQKNYDSILQCLTHLICILLQVVESKEDHELIGNSVRHLVCNNIRSAQSKRTLLHLSVLATNRIDTNEANAIFPNAEVTRFLLECGSHVNANDNEGSTPLLLASKNYNREVVSTLIEYGAHLDLPNLSGDRASSLLKANPANDIRVEDHISLQCICASHIVAFGIPYRDKTAPPLAEFIQAHDHVSLT